MTDVELKPGAETSEYKLTRLVVIAGALVTAAGTVLEALAAVGIGSHFVGVALIVVGVLTKILQVSGYQAKRTALKTTAIESVNYANQLKAEAIKTLPDALAQLETTAARLEAEAAGREAMEVALDMSKA